MTSREKTVLTSIDKLTIPFRFVLPTMMGIFLYVYHNDQRATNEARVELSMSINQNINEIKMSIQRSDDEQKKLMGDYRNWRENTEHRLTKAEFCCWQKEHSDN